MSRVLKGIGLLVVLILFCGLRYLDFGTAGDIDRTYRQDHKILVVYAPPLGGRTSRPELETLVRATYPTADILVPTYSHEWLSNIDPYEITRRIEEAIDAEHTKHHYEKIVLFGYSTGGLLLRKVLLWGYGREDRPQQLTRGSHDWAKRVERFVSLAAPNRGWPNHRPENLDRVRYAIGYVAQEMGRLTGTGRFIASLMQGSPFVANMRIQWIDLFRSLPEGERPLIVHLIGGKDELVDREDSIDLEAGSPEGVMYKSLSDFSHAEIASRMYQDGGKELTIAGEAIQEALTRTRGSFPASWADKIGKLKTEPEVTRLVFVMHGIRDEDTWPAAVGRSIGQQMGKEAKSVKVLPPLYSRFTMLPFLFYWDRQSNVRWFMDQYTEARARYPNLSETEVDYIGHSNGTYILASALQNYQVLKVKNVFFAGSVVPTHYPWEKMMRDKRVTGRVWNICASGDWVVALLPQLFQQISDQMKITESTPGLLDIGSGGFHGFRHGGDGRVMNLQYIPGPHGAAFEPDRIEAIGRYAALDPNLDFEALWGGPKKSKPGHLEDASNMSWLIWIVGLGLIGSIGFACYRFGWIPLGIYCVLLLGFFNTF
ncbi:hypothetical protein JQ617_34855 [Bradyrhizobium sp. KB893862 SZCCT0404]|uniref:hypothetical protein n=1 Tax=Bradyrhizobium sp. KB893862 SZCCT0404 TaxID=2807672 RepID=UPI001BA8DC7E|nr:hypothetical protein [Bradyrhizobium sp. KB893862 SZCCT0404]MBR1179188.1 hypothetical protein [Bradyrhizobium sp. KB893862 SZCCT0404]